MRSEPTSETTDATSETTDTVAVVVVVSLADAAVVRTDGSSAFAR